MASFRNSLLLGEKDSDSRYERAAARWLSRLLAERELEVSESVSAVAAVGALAGRSSQEALAMLKELVHQPVTERPVGKRSFHSTRLPCNLAVGRAERLP
jgi:hypothetical protein